MRAAPQTQNLLIKNCTFILTCLNFSHLQSALHLMQYTYWDPPPTTAWNSFWTRWFWCLLVLLPFFCFTSSMLTKRFSLRTFFYPGKQKKVVQGEIRWIGRVGHEGSCHFWSKTAESQRGVDRGTFKSPIMKWANMLRLLKKFTEGEHSLSQGQVVRWYSWVPRILT